MRKRAVVGCALLSGLIWGVAAGAAVAQAANHKTNEPPTGSASQTPYTLQVNSRVVLTDVTVTDKSGQPVRGLTEQDFRIFDNGKAQTVSSFEEHHEQMAKLEETAAERDAGGGSFSNESLLHPPPQVNVLLFDTTTVRVVDQMYLFEQMKQFVDALPAGQPVAVYTRSGDAAIRLCGFTDDHARLMRAIGHAIPRLRQPGAWMMTDVETLQQMSVYLSQIPGRKNLIWFTGGSNLYLNTDPTQSAPGNPQLEQELQAMYDMVEKERIAIYPIDARGLTVAAPNPFQQIQMREEAAATGGEATMNTNGLALATQHILETDGDYYTLTYAPQGLRNNGTWHNVKVQLEEKGYQLSYRRGYYDDGSNQTAAGGKTRTVLRADGSREEVPNNRIEPIIFRAEVTAISRSATASEARGLRPKRWEAPYDIQYFVPARDVRAESGQGNKATAIVGTAVLAFNQDGEPAGRQFHETRLLVDEEKARTVPDATIIVHQRVNLSFGRNYLYLAVWDTRTGRLGTVNAEVKVQKPAGGGR
jgi:VWFA-related protein